MGNNTLQFSDKKQTPKCSCKWKTLPFWHRKQNPIRLMLRCFGCGKKTEWHETPLATLQEWNKINTNKEIEQC